MIIAYTLTMPNRGSWNGGWSGQENLYCIVKNYGKSQKRNAKAESLLGSHHYSWSDGWGANVHVGVVDSKEARSLRNRSRGFCGYEWMISSLWEYGKIYADHEKPVLDTAATVD